MVLREGEFRMSEVTLFPMPELSSSAVERIWHKQASQSQILALAFGKEPQLKVFQPLKVVASPGSGCLFARQQCVGYCNAEIEASFAWSWQEARVFLPLSLARSKGS